MTYQRIALEKLATLIKDGTHGTHKNVENGPYLLSAQNIENGNIIINENERRISKEDFNIIHRSYKLQNNDILITIVGSLGRCAILKNYNGDFTFQRSVAIIRFNKTRIIPKFAYYQIQTNAFQKELTRRESKGAQGGVYLGELAKIQMIVPDLGTQQKIVQILETLHKQIGIIDLLIEAYGTLFRSTRKIIVSNAKSPQFRFEECFIEMPKPKGIKKNEYEQMGKYPIIDQERNKQISGWTNNEKYVIDVRKPCIIFGDHSRVIKYIEKGKYAFSNDGIKMIITKNIVNNYYGYLLLSNINIPDTGYNRHFKYLKIEKFIVPNLEEQKKATDYFETINKLVISLKSKRQSLVDQYKYLLNHLINGDFDLSSIKLENGKEHK